MKHYNSFIYFIYHSISVFVLFMRITISYLLVIYAVKIFEINYPLEKLKEKNIRNAKRYKKTATKLRGGLIKVAQFLTTQKDIIPPEIIKELEVLQDKVEPVNIKTVKNTIEEELFDKAENIFVDFEDDCVASASFGQVHKAKLKTGEIVAIKVQHKCIEKTLKIDMILMKYVFLFFATLLNRKHLLDIYKEISNALLTELDYEKEAYYAKKFKENFKNRNDVIIPSIYEKYSTKKVLTMDFIDGYKINDLENMKRLNINPENILKLLVDLYFQQFYHNGFFHSDPHPGNIFFLPGPKLAFIDFGQSKELDDKIRRELKNIVVSLIIFNIDEIANSFIRMGFVNESDRNHLKKLFDTIFSRIKTGSPNEIIALTTDFNFIKNNIIEIIKQMEIIMPDGVALYGRTLAYINGLITTLSPDMNMFDLSRELIFKY